MAEQGKQNAATVGGQRRDKQGRRTGLGATALGIARSKKAATGRNKAGAAFAFQTMIPKSGNRFLEKIMVKQTLQAQSSAVDAPRQAQ